QTLLSRLEEYAIWAASTPTLRGTVPDQQQRHPLGLSGGGLADAVRLLQAGAQVQGGEGYIADALSDAIGMIDWALDLGAEARAQSPISPAVPSGQLVLSFDDRFMGEAWRRIAAYECSEGALYVLAALALAVSSPPPLFLAIDDFDHALNPRLARALVERFCDWVTKHSWGRPERQVLITTHNPLILDGLDLTDDRIRLFAVERTSKGRTVAERVLVDDRLLARAKEGWTLSRLWVMGEIGGVPNV
ncbi:MAG: ATP-binding protein, partial [Armatimonadetes bacterium]|nr:ATP-binding protein [Armatimonadota bacterium]